MTWKVAVFEIVFVITGQFWRCRLNLFNTYFWTYRFSKILKLRDSGFVALLILRYVIGTWNHSGVFYGWPSVASDLVFCQDVHNCCRERYWKFQREFSSTRIRELFSENHRGPKSPIMARVNKSIEVGKYRHWSTTECILRVSQKCCFDFFRNGRKTSIAEHGMFYRDRSQKWPRARELLWKKRVGVTTPIIVAARGHARCWDTPGMC